VISCDVAYKVSTAVAALTADGFKHRTLHSRHIVQQECVRAGINFIVAAVA
jgi:hypothetical protein